MSFRNGVKLVLCRVLYEVMTDGSACTAPVRSVINTWEFYDYDTEETSGAACARWACALRGRGLAAPRPPALNPCSPRRPRPN